MIIFIVNFLAEEIHAFANYTESSHDIKLASASGLIVTKLGDNRKSPGFSILADSAFVNGFKFTTFKILPQRKSTEIHYILSYAKLASVDIFIQ